MTTNDKRAFLTGSHAYGQPRPDSDVDLVVFVSNEVVNTLRGLADIVTQIDSSYDDHDAVSLRFGELNLLCVTDPLSYAVWLAGTWKLKKRRPVAREDACALFAKLRKSARASHDSFTEK